MADKLERQPELLDIPLGNIKRWIAAGRLGSNWALELWEKKIEAARNSEVAMEELLAFLRRDGEDERQLKSCSPFAGVLTREESDQFTCAWTH